MQKIESTNKDIALFYEGIVDMVSHSEVDLSATLAVLTRCWYCLQCPAVRIKKSSLSGSTMSGSLRISFSQTAMKSIDGVIH